MGNPISFRDLFDFEGDDILRRAEKDVRGLTEAYEEFRDIVSEGMYERLANEQSKLAQTVRDLIKANKDLLASNKENQKLIVESVGKMQELEAQQKKLAETKLAVAKADEVAADSVEGLKKHLKELTAEYNKLSQSEAGFEAQQKDLADEINHTRQEIHDLTAAIKVNVKTFNAAKGSYDALDNETKELVRDLKSLEGGMDATSSKAQRLKKQIFENTQKLKQFDREMNQNFRNVGNYSSALGGLAGNLKSYALGLVSIAALTRGIQESFDISLRFDAAARSLEFVSDSAVEAEKNMIFLRRIAQDLGLDFESLVKTFARFSAATKDTNLEGDTTRRIFESVAKASAVMKLSTEELNGVMLALEQIVSKGKLQAEELRKQLGNRLPGAFKLFAAGLGLSTAELDEFLKQGKITADALVPFAQRLEEVFGAGTQDNVDALQSNVNRLNNTFKELFQGKGLNTFYNDFIKGVNTLVREIFQLDQRSLQLAITQKNEAIQAEQLVTEYEKLIDKTDKTTEEKERLQSIVTTLTSMFGNSVVEIDKETGALRLNIEATKELITQKLLLANDKAAAAAAKYKQALDQQKVAAENAEKATKALNMAGQETGVVYEDLKDIMLTPNRATGSLPDTKILTSAQMKVYQLGIAYDQQKTRVSNASKEVAKYADELKQLGFSIEDVNKLLNPQGGGDGTYNPKDEPLTPEELERLRQKQLRDTRKFLKATEKLRLEQLAYEYSKEDDTLENKILFEDKKLQIIRESVNQQQALYKKGSTDYISLEAELVKATADRQKEIEKINNAIGKNTIKNAEKGYKDLLKSTQAYFDYLKAEEDKNTTKKINDLILQGVNDPSQSNRASIDLQIFEIRKGILQKEVEAARNAVEQKRQTDEEYWKNKKRLADAEKALEQEKSDFAIAQAQRVAEAKQEIEQAAFDFVSTSSNSLFQIQAYNLQREENIIQKRYEYEMRLAGNNVAAKDSAERKYQNDLRAAKKKQSENEKSAAIFQISINTAAAAARALVDYPFPYSLFIAGLAAASGFAQLSAVQAEPVPEYWKGRKNGPKEFARVNEKGPELIRRKGKYFVAGGGEPTTTLLQAGDQVFTHEESVKKVAADYEGISDTNGYMKSLLEGTGVHIQEQQYESDKIVNAIANHALNENVLARNMSKAMKELPLENIVFDERGYNRFTQKKNQKIAKSKSRNSLTGNG